MANEFNNVFVDVGPNLHIIDEKLDIDKNLNSMYLGPVCESDILEVVRKCKSKRSTDCNDIEMSMIKEVIHTIVRPYICNSSFEKGIFPDNEAG